MTRTTETQTQTKSIIVRQLLFGLFWVVVVPWVVASEFSEFAITKEYQFKAAFLYHFTKFIEWPIGVNDQADTTFGFCIMGFSPLEPALHRLIGDKMVRGLKPTIKRVVDFDEVDRCHVLFISRTEQSAVANFVNILRNSSILTVGETPNFAQQGGIIEFVIVNNKLSFAINIEAAKRMQLKLSSELLKLAEIVYGSTEK